MAGQLMIDGTFETGIAGEELAAADLKRQGWSLLARRYRTRWGEIDLVARRGDLVAFVEVKSSGPGRIRRPDAIQARARHRIRRAAVAWMAAELRSHAGARRFRFDVAIAKVGQAGTGEVTWWTDAF